MLNFNGMSLSAVAALAGESEKATRKWLKAQGYSVRPERVHLHEHPRDIEDRIAKQRAEAASPVPCWRCGARAGCGHR